MARTFVVPLDGSPYAERAFPIAAALAKRVDGGLMLVSVAEHGPLHPDEYLAEVAAAHPGVPTECVSVENKYAAEAIVSILGESDDRTVCMTSHGRGGLRWGVIGSVAEEVMRRADRPLLLVGRHCRQESVMGARQMLVCVDGSEASAQLAPVAREWAGQLGLDLRAAIVVHPLDVESAERPNVVLDPIIEQLGGPEHATATLLSSRYIEGALVDYAEKLPAALIAMNAHGRTGLARVALGSTTMGVLHKAPCPLLVASIRPTIT